MEICILIERKATQLSQRNHEPHASKHILTQTW